MKRNWKSLCILAVLICCFALFVQVSSAEIASGSCGANLTWVLDEDGVLTISGEGEMWFYEPTQNMAPPWHNAGVKAVIIEEGVTSIGHNAFANCYDLSTVTISDSVTNISKSAFTNCGIQKLIIADGSKKVTAAMIVGKDTLEELVIPSSVVYLDETGLQYSPKLTTVTFEDNSQLTTIGYGTFAGCGSLETVDFGENSRLTKIDGQAFYVCRSLKNIVIPDSVTEIGSGAFSYVDALTDIVIPDGVRTIDSGVFAYCKNLKNVQIGSSIVDIKGSAFAYCSALSSITIPQQVTAIGNSAFQDCSQLTRVSFAENGKLKSIGKQAFENCTALAAITLPDSVTELGLYVFRGCSGLTDATMGSSIRRIPVSTFESCTSLTNVSLGNVTMIDAWAFRNCTSLTDITIPQSVTDIGEEIFSGCGSLESITFPYIEISDEVKTFGYFFGMDSYTGGRAVKQHYYDSWFDKTIERDFYIPASLKSVTINGGAIPERAFENCISLENVRILSRVKEINSYAFYNCKSLNSVIMENGLTDIAGYAFENCSSLTELVLPDSVTALGTYAFRNCTSLKSVTIPASVTTIGWGAFRECSSITQVTFAENSRLTTIDDAAFEDCTGLTYLTIPKSVERIGYDAFKNCYITTVFFEGTEEERNAMSIKKPSPLTSAVWHYQTVATVFAEQNCYYCAACDNYFLCDGSYAMATVVFKDWDGTMLETRLYKYGDTLKVPNVPAREHENPLVYQWLFAGWDQQPTVCTGNAEYTAVFKEIYVNYTIAFQNWNGAVISTKTYHWGDPVTTPAIPSRAADKTYTYTFAGWDKTVVNCAGDATYTATYTPAYIDYTVEFKDWNGTLLSTGTYHWKDEITIPANPARVADNTYTYTFTGWDKTVEQCAGNATYTATYKATYISYKVEFKNWNGNVLSSKLYHWGDPVTVPAKPARAADKTYTYTFAGWDKAVVNCAGNATYTATYIPVYIEYTVTFQYADGTTISSAEYYYGDAVIVPDDPAAPGANYVFLGWDKEIADCTGNAIYTAVFQKLFTTGDIDGDQAVTQDDAVYLLLHTMFGEMFYPLNNAPADIDNNGSVNQEDAVYLLLHTMFGEMFYPLNTPVLPVKPEE